MAQSSLKCNRLLIFWLIKRGLIIGLRSLSSLTGIISLKLSVGSSRLTAARNGSWKTPGEKIGEKVGMSK